MDISTTRPELSASAFGRWLDKAAAGDVFEYHRGFLALDIDENASPLPSEERLLLVATAAAAYHAAAAGAVHLLQRRLASHVFSYVAVRRGSRSVSAKRVQLCS